MNKIEKRIRINVPAPLVFEQVNRPIHLLEICSNLKAVHEVQSLKDGGSSFKWDYKLAEVHLLGESETTEIAVNRFIVNRIHGGVTGVIRWLFEPQQEETEVTLIIQCKLPVPLLRKHSEASILNEIEAAAANALASLKKRLEASTESEATDVASSASNVV